MSEERRRHESTSSTDRPEPEDALSDAPNADRDARGVDVDVRDAQPTEPGQHEPPIDDDDRARRADQKRPS